MAKLVLILEDSRDRRLAMEQCLVDLQLQSQVFDNVPAMAAWLQGHQPSAALISLDHDLDCVRGPGGQLLDAGDGRQAAAIIASLAPSCPVIVHTSSSYAASVMRSTLEDRGWQVTRVVPQPDVAWVHSRWAQAVMRLVQA